MSWEELQKKKADIDYYKKNINILEDEVRLAQIKGNIEQAETARASIETLRSHLAELTT